MNYPIFLNYRGNRTKSIRNREKSSRKSKEQTAMNGIDPRTRKETHHSLVAMC